MKAAPDSGLLPGEWAVLASIAEQPTHGFAVARLLAPAGPLGGIWTVTRPRVYRAIADLAARDLIAPMGEEAGTRGPSRTIYDVTPVGRRLLEEWLAAPVEHVRDVRSELLLKLALLDRAGAPAAQLLDAQRALLVAAAERLRAALAGATGFDATLLRFRAASVEATLGFIDATRAAAGEAPTDPSGR